MGLSEFEIVLNPEKDIIVKDHCVMGKHIFPGAGYLELVIANSNIDTAEGLQLNKITINSPLVFEGKMDQSIVVELSNDRNEYHFAVKTRQNNGEWVKHTEGQVKKESKSSPKLVDLEQLKTKCCQSIDVEDYYDMYRKAGLEYGPYFQSISRIQFSGHEVLAEICLKELTKDEFLLNPAIIDAAFQSIGIFSFTGEAKQLYLPFFIDRVSVYQALSNHLYCYGKLRSDNRPNSAIKRYDLLLCNSNGEVEVQIDALCLKSVPAAKRISKVNIDQSFLNNILWKPYWKSSTKLNQSKDLKNKVFLSFMDDKDLAEDAAKKFEKEGCQFIKVYFSDHFQKASENLYYINTMDMSSYEELIESLGERLDLIDYILHFGSIIDYFKVTNSSEELDQRLHHGVYSLYYFIKCMIKRGLRMSVQLKVVSKNSYVASFEEKTVYPENAALAGFCNVVNREFPNISTSFIDLEEKNLNDQVDIIIEEICSDSNQHSSVVYRNGIRYLPAIQKIEGVREEIDLPLKDEGIYLITGGCGDIGLEIAKYLAQKVKAHLVLINRTAYPPSSKWEWELNHGCLENRKKEKIKKLLEIKAIGGKVTLINGDISNLERVKEIVHTITKNIGPINGVVHSAGLLKDQLIKNLALNDFKKVVKPKIWGTWALDQVFQNYELDFFVLCSSIATVISNPGQANYVVGNSYMDSFAHYRNLIKKLPAQSINWSLWEETGMSSPVVVDKAKEVGIIPLQNDKGIACFEQALGHSEVQIIVLEQDDNKFDIMKLYQSHEKKQETPTAQKKTVVHGEIFEEQLKVEVQNLIKDILSDVLKVSKNEFALFISFLDFGLDSIMVSEVIQLIEDKTKILLEPTLFFEYKTIDELSEYLVQNYRESLFDSLIEADKDNNQISIVEQVEKNDIEETIHLEDDIFQDCKNDINNPDENVVDFSFAAEDQDADSSDIAVIGFNCRFPQADDADQFWENLKAGKDCITEIPSERWDGNYYYDRPETDSLKIASKWGGFLQDIDKFDAAFFNISPAEARVMDPQQRMLLESSWELMEQSGYIGKECSRQTGVFIGASYHHYEKEVLESTDYGNLYSSLGNSLALIANRISYCLGLQGPSLVLDTMCSSSLVAIATACENLKNNSCVVAIAGGVNAIIPVSHYLGLSKLKALSPDGKCKAFDLTANGFVSGEGVGLLLLKKLSQAKKDGDKIYGVIKGVTVNHDGKSSGLTAPNPVAQEKVIVEAYKKADINPETISYLEAHGTGTSLGDSIEMKALTKAFRRFTQKNSFCSLGSVKSNIGHLEPAGGVAGVIKIILAMKNRQIPPTIHFNRPNPLMKMWQTPFYIQDRLQEWETELEPRRAAVFCYGMGGTNAHLIMEEYLDNSTEQIEIADDRQQDLPHIVTLAAKSESALTNMVIRLKEYVNGTENLELEDICYTLQTCRKHFDKRLAFVCNNMEAFLDKLELISLKKIDNPGLEDFKVFRSRKYDKQENYTPVFVFPEIKVDELTMIKNSVVFLYKNEKIFEAEIKKCLKELPLDVTESVSKYFSTNLVDGTITLNKTISSCIAFCLQYGFIGLLRSINIKPGAVIGEGNGGLLAQVILQSIPLKKALNWMISGEIDSDTYSELISESCLKRDSSAFIKKASRITSKHFLEFGISNSLSNFIGEINNTSRIEDSSILKSGRTGWKVIYEVIAKMYSMGIDIDWEGFYGGKGKKIDLPLYPFERRTFWVNKENQITNNSEGQTAKTSIDDVKSVDKIIEEIDTKEAIEVNYKSGISKNQLAKKISDIFVDIICSNLGYSIEEVGLDMELDELGFDSILASKVTSIYCEKFGLEIDPTILFEYPTISRYSRYIAEEYHDILQRKLCNDINPSTLKRENDQKEVEKTEVEDAEQKDVNEIEDIEQGIAIIGMAGRFPGAANVEQLWEKLAAGYCAITEVPKERWDIDKYYDADPNVPGKTNCRYGSFLEDIDKFDPGLFGISVNKAALIDPQQRLMLEVALEAIEDSGYGNGLLAGTKTGVYIGVSNNEYIHKVKQDVNKINAHIASGNTFSVIANRISYFFDLRGPSQAIDTACSSSLVAIHNACQSILNGECNMALVGGVNLTQSVASHLVFSKAQVLSPEGCCRPFDAEANGYVRGEGVGAVLLKPLQQAIVDGDNIHALIRGSAVNHGGRTNGLNSPSALAQKEVLIETYKNAGISMETLSFMEVHGTGTPLGDSIEARGLADAFREFTKKKNFCALSTIKSNIGHLESAAGIAGMIKAILALKNRKIPPVLNFEKSNPKIRVINSAFYICDKLRDLEGSLPLRAGVSTFGFGGTNAHVILEMAPLLKKQRTKKAKFAPICTLSSRNKDSLTQMIENMTKYLKKNEDEDLYQICFTLNTGHSHYHHRIAVEAGSVEELMEKLKRAKDLTSNTDGVHLGLDIRKAEKVVFAYNSNGVALHSNISRFFNGEPIYRDVVEKCVQTSKDYTEVDIMKYFLEDRTLENEDSRASALIRLIHEYAISKVLLNYGIIPDVILTGNGSLATAVIAGVMNIKDVIKLTVGIGGNIEMRPYEIPVLWKNNNGYTLNKTPELNYWLNSENRKETKQDIAWLNGKNSYNYLRISEITNMSDLQNIVIDMYIRGMDINWSRYHEGNFYRKVSLPTYEFNKKSYWLD